MVTEDAYRPARPPSWLRLVLPAVGVAYAIASIAIAGGTERLVTTYAAVSAPLAAAALVPGLGLVAVGGVSALIRSTGWMAPLATLLGMAWLAPLWVGWQGDTAVRFPLTPLGDGPEVARSAGMGLVPFLVPALAHLMLAFPAGQVRTPNGRVLVGAGYASAAVVSVGRALFYDPFLDPFCWRNCTDNSFLLHAEPQLVRALGEVGLQASAVLGGAIAIVATWRFARATAVGRSALRYVLAPAAAAAVAEAVYAVVLLRDPAESPEREPFMTLFVVRGGALTLLALGLAWTMLRIQQRRTAVARLADELGAAPPLGSLRAALAQVLRDDRVDVGYWLPDARRHVDASGRPFEPQPGRDRAVTSIRRNGHPVAAVVHDRALYDDQRLEREIGSAARLAIDNERLRAALLAQLEDLRASRARIVETGDEARRRLERDLHDGAQQRLLAVTYELRLGCAAAKAAGAAQLAATLGVAVDDAQTALAELREIAHGIFPTILEESGLGPALWTLTDRAELPVEIADVPDERLPGRVERTAYLVVTEAVMAATRHDQAALSVRIDRTPGILVVTVEGGPEDPYDHIADRVGALGGRLSIERHRLRAEIPCD